MKNDDKLHTYQPLQPFCIKSITSTFLLSFIPNSSCSTWYGKCLHCLLCITTWKSDNLLFHKHWYSHRNSDRLEREWRVHCLEWTVQCIGPQAEWLEAVCLQLALSRNRSFSVLSTALHLKGFWMCCTRTDKKLWNKGHSKRIRSCPAPVHIHTYLWFPKCWKQNTSHQLDPLQRLWFRLKSKTWHDGSNAHKVES